MSVKILHCADFHFGTPFSGLSVKAASQRREELLQTFSNIIDMAREERVEVLLLAGDIFDSKRVNKGTIEFMFRRFGELKQTRVFIVCGNHDPLNKDSYYHKLALPENVYVFGKDIERVELSEKNAVVYGASFSDSYARDSMIQGFEAKDTQKINIMLLHGELTTEKGGSDYNPVTKTQIQCSKLDYLALGHAHEFSGFLKAGQTTYAYSGAPEGRGFDELGEKGIILGTVDKKNSKLSFVSVCKRQYRLVEIDVSSFSAAEEICAEIRRIKDKVNLYKIVLSGKTGLLIDTDVIRFLVEDDFFFIKIKDETKPDIHYDWFKNDFSLRGLVINSLLDKQKTALASEREVYNDAIKEALAAFEESGEKL